MTVPTPTAPTWPPRMSHLKQSKQIIWSHHSSANGGKELGDVTSVEQINIF